MKNLTANDLRQEFLEISKQYFAVQQEIEDNNITNYGDELYSESYKLRGAMKILQKLINKIK